jgi:hypothetical protein
MFTNFVHLHCILEEVGASWAARGLNIYEAGSFVLDIRKSVPREK